MSLSGRHTAFYTLVAILTVFVLNGSSVAGSPEIDLTSGTAWWTIGESSSDGFSISNNSGNTDNKVTFSLEEYDRDYLKKDPLEAFLRSALLPGWGQRYGDRHSRGTFFTSIEVGLWAGMFLSRESYNKGKDDYINYARQHAGVLGNKSHDFYVDIGNYNSRDAYNRDQLQKRDYSDNYSGNSYFWEWDSSSNRYFFEDLRITTDRHKNRMYYIAGGMFLNRLFSAIDASRGVIKRQKEIKKSDVSFGYDPSVGGPSIVWRGTLGVR